MRAIAGHLQGKTATCGLARAAAAVLVLLAGAACGGGSGADAAGSLASLAAGASFVGEQRLRGAVPAVYARHLLDDLRGQAAEQAQALREPDAGPGAPSALADAERLDTALALMRRAVEADDRRRLRSAAVEANSLAQSLSETAREMKGGTGG